jgi:hypothetical protein
MFIDHKQSFISRDEYIGLMRKVEVDRDIIIFDASSFQVVSSTSNKRKRERHKYKVE